MTEDNGETDDGECPFCATAEPTDLDRLSDAMNECFDGAQLSPYENLGALTIKNAKLDLRKQLVLLTNDEVVDLHINKGSEDYKLLVEGYEHGKRVDVSGKTREECMAILGLKPGGMMAPPCPESDTMRPGSIAEVARRRGAWPDHPLWKPVCEFLDDFYESDATDCRRSMLAEEPTPVLVEQEAAYLAGVAEYLSIYYGLATPAWVHKPRYFLKRPYFPGPWRSRLVDALCAVESPFAFRRRLVFVEHEPLRRKQGPRTGHEALRSIKQPLRLGR